MAAGGGLGPQSQLLLRTAARPRPEAWVAALESSPVHYRQWEVLRRIAGAPRVAVAVVEETSSAESLPLRLSHQFRRRGEMLEQGLAERWQRNEGVR